LPSVLWDALPSVPPNAVPPVALPSVSPNNLPSVQPNVLTDTLPPAQAGSLPPAAAAAPKATKSSESRFKRWTKQEDAKLLKACEAIQDDKEHNWCRISRVVFGGVRSSVQCKSRWHNVS
jgi:hypothetical protein